MIDVVNRGDRPIQVGSDYPFTEVNGALVFDRGAATGMHLDIPAGTAVRFEPGESRRCSSSRWRGGPAHEPGDLTRDRYAAMFGPTTGDRMRLGDTELVIEVETDVTDLRRWSESAVAK